MPIVMNAMDSILTYENETFDTRELYNVLGFSTVPTDRELEAKIIQMIQKYSYYEDSTEYESDKSLYWFFHKVYDFFFATVSKEGFEEEKKEEEEEDDDRVSVEHISTQPTPIDIDELSNKTKAQLQAAQAEKAKADAQVAKLNELRKASGQTYDTTTPTAAAPETPTFLQIGRAHV